MLMITAERRAAVRNVRELSLMRSAQVQVADLQPLLQLVTKRKINVVPRLTVKQAAAYIPVASGH